MGRRRKASERREPVFDVAPEPRRDQPAALRRRRSRAGRRSPAPRKRSKGGSRRPAARRTGFGRVVYWGAVAGAVAGDRRRSARVVWVGAHLPPIQSLEVPKRPPSIQIVDLQRPAARHARRHGRRRGAAQGAAAPRAAGLHRDRGPPLLFALRHRPDRHRARRSSPTCCAAACRRAARPSPSSSPRTCSSRRSARSPARCRSWRWRCGSSASSARPQILELYLNRVYFGAGAYGIEAAAQRYFGKPAQKLTVAEAAMLAGPRALAVAACAEPQSGRRRAARPDRARRHGGDEVHHRRHGQGRADRSPAHAVKSAGAGSVDYVADWVMDVLDDLVGRVEQDIVVETSIDPALQAAAEKALVEELAKNGEKAGVGQGALVAMSPDGAVRALVGGRNYAESQFNRAVAAKRQPGSAFKPFVYLTALERGLTPDTRARGQADRDQGLAAGELQPRIFRPGHAQAGAGDVAQHRVGAADAGVRPDRGGAHRAPARHRLQARAQRLDRARHLGGLGARAGRRLSRRSPMAAWRSTPHVVERVRTADGKVLYQRKPQNLGRIVEPRYVAMMNAMMQETLAHRHRAQGRAAGLARRRQDRHLAGFPRRLVRRLHRPSRRRRLARQRRRLADQQDHRRRHCRSRSGAEFMRAGAPGRAGRGLPGTVARLR